MHDEFNKPVSHEPWLSKEQRRKMSERNRGKARQAKEQTAAPAKPDAAEIKARQEEQLRAERLRRKQQSELNRQKARAKADRESRGEAAKPVSAVSEQTVSATPQSVPRSEPSKPQVPQERAVPRQEATASARTVRGERYGRSKAPARQRRLTARGSLLMGLLAILLIGCVIYGRMRTNEIYTTIAQLQEQYDDICARNVSMKSEMEGKMTVKNIEDYAENELGLKQLDQSQITYIQIQTEDEVTITEPESNWIVALNDWFVSLWEFLRGA